MKKKSGGRVSCKIGRPPLFSKDYTNMPGGIYSYEKEALIRLDRAIEPEEVEHVLDESRRYFRNKPYLQYDLQQIEEKAGERLRAIRWMQSIINNLDLPAL